MQEKTNITNQRTPRVKRTIPYIAMLLLISGTRAQQQPQGMTIKVNTRLVVETVVVKDNHGREVEGLSKEDFALTENDVPQIISVFQFQKLEDTPMTSQVAPLTTPSIDIVRPVGSAGVTASFASAAQYSNRRFLVLFFDLTAMPEPDQLRAVDAADRFIRYQMKSPDVIAIVTLDSSGVVKVLRDFTDERNALLDALRLIYRPASNNDTDDQASAFGHDVSEFQIFSADRQLAALKSVVDMLKSVGGRKGLIYFASGLKLNDTYNQAQLSATVNAAVRANVALFPVDARGLVAPPPLGDASQVSAGGVGVYSGTTTMASMTTFQRSQDTLFALASDTGGEATLDRNDLTAGIVLAEQAIRSYYVIGYYPTNSTLDGKFRRVRVTVKDTPFVKLDFRPGYFAEKSYDKFTASDKERQLEDALRLADPITDLTIEVEVNFFHLDDMEYIVPIAVKIPGDEVGQVRNRNGMRTLLDFVGEVKDDRGRTIQRLRDRVDLTFRGETADLVKRPIQYDTAFTLRPGGYVIKFLARDIGTGRIGTYESRFTIPNVIKEEKYVPISSVVLSNQLVDLKNAFYSVGKSRPLAQAALASNPLILQGWKLVPSVTRIFSESREMYVYLEAYEPNVRVIHPIVVFLMLRRGQTRVLETSAVQFMDGLDRKSTTLPVKLRLALPTLPLGEYDLQITVLDPTTQKVAFWQAPVMLVP